MNAHPNDQRTLLRLQEFDVRSLQLEHQLRQLPFAQQLDDLDAADAASVRERLEAYTELEAARTEVARIGSDVEIVRARIERDTLRESQSSSSKDLEALEHELDSLRARLSMLEDAELEQMQRVEDAEHVIALIDGRAAERADARSAVGSSFQLAVDEIDRERDALASDRRAIAATVDPALLAEYERRRERTGTGAGLLRQKTCGACSIVLTGTDLERVRQLPADVVAHCPECDAILVRTEESGL